MNPKSLKGFLVILGIFLIGDSALINAFAQKPPTPENLDAKVEKFLKEWYPQYFKDLEGKLVKGGCFTAHNVNQALGSRSGE